MTDGPEQWLAARRAAGIPDETWRPMARLGRCTFGAYEVSDQGRARRLPSGEDVSTRAHRDGYRLANFRCDQPASCPRHGRHTFTLHQVVLTTFDRARPHGMQACHSPAGPAANWWPEGVRWDTQSANQRDKPEQPVPPDPTYPCISVPGSPACDSLVIRQGRRCVPCTEEVGRQAGDMLRRKMPLQQVAEHFGYTGGDWVYQLAVRHGGYAASKAEARTQRPPLTGWRKAVAHWVGAQ